MSPSLSRNSSRDSFEDLVRECLNRLYEVDGPIFERNEGEGVSERSIVFRFAHYLQDDPRLSGFFVDCDFNSSFKGYEGPNGKFVYQDVHGKPLIDESGREKLRFVDIIVHKRENSPQNDLICFEIKKWNNTHKKDFAKDHYNLIDLTRRYGYVCGFQITLHRNRWKSYWTIYEGGRVVDDKKPIFAMNEELPV